MAGELIRRDQLERIIQRAAELQAGERDIGEGLTEEELIALGKDVGIPTRYLRQALLEEQTRGPALVPDQWEWLAGPPRLVAERVVPGERAAVERAIGLWMEEEELLRVKRRFADRVSWEPQVGFLASMQRGLRAGGKTYALSQAAEVSGRVLPLESGFCHVSLAADVRNVRARRLGGAGVLAGLGLAGTAAMALMGVFGLFAAVPLVAFGMGGWAVARTHASADERVQVGLEQVLDRLERGEIRPEHALPGPRASAFVRIADELRKNFL
ncbi:MAG TPA: hypothetical protein VMH88_00820 [Gemmatimonadales bacterium]|nr:hypothetical protein [Gemmatimonadales bacterium]